MDYFVGIQSYDSRSMVHIDKMGEKSGQEKKDEVRESKNSPRQPSKEDHITRRSGRRGGKGYKETGETAG